MAEANATDTAVESAYRKSDRAFIAMLCLFYLPFRQTIFGLPTLAQRIFESRAFEVVLGVTMLFLVVRMLHFKIWAGFHQYGWKFIPYVYISKYWRSFDFGLCAKALLIFIGSVELLLLVARLIK